MNLSRSELLKIYLSFNLSQLKISVARISESDDGGIIYLQHPPYSDDHVTTIFAINKEKWEESFEKIYTMKQGDAFIIVLPFDSLSSSLLYMISKLENRWVQRRTGKAYRIEVVADAGEDNSTSETKYNYGGFDDGEELANVIKRELIIQGAQPDLNPYAISSLMMKNAIKSYLAKNSQEGVTLHHANKLLQDVKFHS